MDKEKILRDDITEEEHNLIVEITGLHPVCSPTQTENMVLMSRIIKQKAIETTHAETLKEVLNWFKSKQIVKRYTSDGEDYITKPLTDLDLEELKNHGAGK